MNEKTKPFLAVIFIAATWLVAEILVWPVGDFPLNDDWSFAVSVWSLVKHGQLELTCWTLAASLTHIFSGALTSSLFGFSFHTLRATEMLWAALASWCTWKLIFDRTRSVAIASFVVLWVLFDPLFFNLANSYMTDVTGFALSVMTVWLLSRFWLSDKSYYLYGAIASVILMVLNRQVSVVIPISFAISYLLFNKRSVRNILYAALPAAVGIAVVSLHDVWLRQFVGGYPFCYVVEKLYLNNALSRHPLLVIGAFITVGTRMTIYLGGLSLPLCIWAAPQILAPFQAATRKFLIALIIELGVLIGFGLIGLDLLMPLGDNLIYNTGLGPVLLSHAEQNKVWSQAPKSFWMAITFICGIGVGFLFTYVSIFVRTIFNGWRTRSLEKEDAIVSFALLCGVMYFVVLSVRGFFDRYLILFLPFIALIVVRLWMRGSAVPVTAKWANALACGGMILLAAYSVAGTHDYFQWNRLRASAVSDLLSQKILMKDIDAGMELNDWDIYTSGESHPPITKITDRVNNQKWLVAASPVKGYKLVREYPFKRWLMPSTDSVLVLTKE